MLNFNFKATYSFSLFLLLSIKVKQGRVLVGHSELAENQCSPWSDWGRCLSEPGKCNFDDLKQERSRECNNCKYFLWFHRCESVPTHEIQECTQVDDHCCLTGVWSECSTTCGDGIKTHEERCIVKAESAETEPTISSTLVTEKCNCGPCPPRFGPVVFANPGPLPSGVELPLQCTADSDPPAVVAFGLDDTHIGTNDSPTFTPDRSDDGKLLSCIATYADGSTTMTSYHLIVRDVGTATISGSATVIRGNSQRYECSSTGDPELEYSFTYDGSGAVFDPNFPREYRISPNEDDNGKILTCTARNVVGESTTSITLDVQYIETPEITISGTNSGTGSNAKPYIVTVGDVNSYVFSCAAEGNPPPSYSLIYNGANGGCTVNNDGSSCTLQLAPEQTGTVSLTCEASNDASSPNDPPATAYITIKHITSVEVELSINDEVPPNYPPNANEDEKLTISCNVNSNPEPASVNIIIDGVTVTSGSHNTFHEVPAILDYHEKELRCQAIDIDGVNIDSSNFITLEVYHLSIPIITSNLDPADPIVVTVGSGENYEFTCASEDSHPAPPEYSFTYIGSGTCIKDDPGPEDKCTLMPEDGPPNTETILCTARNDADELDSETKNIEIQYLAKPAASSDTTTTPPKANEEEMMTLSCDVLSNPIPSKVEFFIDGSLVAGGTLESESTESSIRTYSKQILALFDYNSASLTCTATHDGVFALDPKTSDPHTLTVYDILEPTITLSGTHPAALINPNAKAVKAGSSYDFTCNGAEDSNPDDVTYEFIVEILGTTVTFDDTSPSVQTTETGSTFEFEPSAGQPNTASVSCKATNLAGSKTSDKIHLEIEHLSSAEASVDDKTTNYPPKANKDEILKLLCDVDSNPSPSKVEFFINGASKGIVDNIAHSAPSPYELEITSDIDFNGATFRCEATHGGKFVDDFGIAVSPGFLLEVYDISIPTITYNLGPDPIIVTAGKEDTYEFTCNTAAYSHSPPDYSFTSTGNVVCTQEVPGVSDKCTLVAGNGPPSIATISCTAINEADTLVSEVKNIEIQYLASAAVSYDQTNYPPNANEEENLKFFCDVVSNPAPSSVEFSIGSVWTKIVTTANGDWMPDGSSRYETVLPADRDYDQKQLTCKAVHGGADALNDVLSPSVTLTVHYLGIIETFTSDAGKTVKGGEQVQLTCEVDGSNPLDVVYTFTITSYGASDGRELIGASIQSFQPQAGDKLVTIVCTASLADVAEATSPSIEFMTLPNIFINEFHYAHKGPDSEEFIELAVATADINALVAATADMNALADYQVDLYESDHGTSYKTIFLSDFDRIDEADGFTFLVKTFDQDEFKNGDPGGLSLSCLKPSHLFQFLSYEGGFTATSGPAKDHPSDDVKVSEDNNTPSEASLQLIGDGRCVDDFTEWAFKALNTRGKRNDGQTFTTGDS